LVRFKAPGGPLGQHVAEEAPQDDPADQCNDGDQCRDHSHAHTAAGAADPTPTALPDTVARLRGSG
jgi:hypothetical protein